MCIRDSDVHGAVNKLPTLNPVAPEEDESVPEGVPEESETIMSPNMSPSTGQNGSSEVTSSHVEGNSESPKKEEKPCENIVLTGLSSVDDIGLENSAETRGISLFDPKVTPNPTLLSQWILKNYSDREIKELILLIGQ